jgi:D-alanine-D-alanine ligase
MRICVLRSSYDGSDSPMASLDPMPDPTPWLDGHEVTLRDLKKSEAPQAVSELVAHNYDVFLNLCDGMWFEDIAGLEVVQALESAAVPFTGPSSSLISLSKEAMKRWAHERGVRTPAFAVARSEADARAAAESLRFPAIVKHIDGCGSIGLTAASRVTDPCALVEQAKVMIAAAGGALIEEFIEGDEYTVLVSEDPSAAEGVRVYEPVQCSFPAGETFKHFDLKWVGFEGLVWNETQDERARERVMEATRTVFTGLGGVSYSRCDYRVDREGHAWFLEINTNCGLFYPAGAEGSADMILQRDPGGHRAFLERILRAAVERARR